jgi:cobalt-precorrin 5A hydrolase/precorrin-3B C17-methyltransferase
VGRKLALVEHYVAEGDVIGIDWAAAEGRFPTLINDTGWPTPTSFRFGMAPERVIITDELGDFTPGVAYLRPPSLVVGIHPRPHAEHAEIEQILIDALAQANLSRSSVYAVSTADHTRNDRSIRRLGYPIRSFHPRRLNSVNVPNPSATLRTIVGTQSVCEASAMLAAGPGAKLVVARTRTKAGTIAIARRSPIRDVIIDLTAPTNAFQAAKR